MTEHLDLDGLADVLAGETPVGAEHVTDCADCRAALADLRSASERTSAALAALPPVTLPADVADRLASALHSAGGSSVGATVTTLPAGRGGVERPGSARWLGAAAAVALILAGGGYAVSQLGHGGSGASSSTAKSGSADTGRAAELHLVRNSSGNDYTSRDALSAALPSLLAGTAAAPDRAVAGTTSSVPGRPNTGAGVNPQAAADPLARLRTEAGLADCLVALLPPENPALRPLAIDYAQYKGQPALVVVLPSTIKNKLDVFVVGPGCSRANDSTLFYTSVDKP